METKKTQEKDSANQQKSSLRKARESIHQINIKKKCWRLCKKLLNIYKVKISEREKKQKICFVFLKMWPQGYNGLFFVICIYFLLIQNRLHGICSWKYFCY